MTVVLFFVDGKLCDGGIDQKTNKQWSAGWSLLQVRKQSAAACGV